MTKDWVNNIFIIFNKEYKEKNNMNNSIAR